VAHEQRALQAQGHALDDAPGARLDRVVVGELGARLRREGVEPRVGARGLVDLGEEDRERLGALGQRAQDVVVHGDAARGIGLIGAGASTAFAAVALGLGVAYTRSPRFLLRHPGAAALTATAALAWWGAL
jgi:hypothetical protein